MAYNNVFPMTYQPMYPQYQPQAQPTPQPQPQPQAQNSTMIWVQGINAAKSYLLAPNTTLPLWDSEAQCIYLKSTDASGMPSMRILDYTIRQDANNQQNNIVNNQTTQDYVTHAELTDLENRITQKIDTISKKEDVSV